MITNKDIRVENGFLIINGNKYPLDGQSPETIMQIVEDNSDTTPTDASTNPVTSGGVYTALTGKAEKNPSSLTEYTHEALTAAASGMTITDIKGGYKVKDGVCYLFMQVSFTGSFNTPGAWNFISGFPASAVDGIPIIATPTGNDTNTLALRGGRINTSGNLYIINEAALTGENSIAFTFVGSYPVATS